MNFWVLVIFLGGAYLLQCVFGLLQIKNFSRAYTPLRKMGKVAIGKKSGGIRSGAIVMFAVDNEGIILAAKRMVGVTVFANFKELKGFEGKNVALLTEEDTQGMSKPLKKAILDATFNYNTIMSGGQLPPSLTPFQKIGNGMKKLLPQK